MKKKIVNIVGARPNFVKIAPVIRQLRRYRNIDSLLVHTGQHYDKEMSRLFFQDLRLPRPDIYLGIGSHSQGVQTARIMIRLEDIIIRENPDLVIVVGDVNSTLAGALVASKLSIPVAHIEAGLRSFDGSMPEEINRVVTDSLSRFLFTHSEDANRNLYREGIVKNKVHFVGNVMIDTLMEFKDVIYNQRILERLGLSKRRYAMVTLHRPSNVDNLQDFKKIIEALAAIQEKIKLIFPVHPRTGASIKKFRLDKHLSKMKRLLLINPLGYLDFLSLMKNSLFVITDSGGIQEETTVLGIPCLTVRENTERPITVVQGTNTVVGTKPESIVKESFKILDGISKAGQIPRFWDGKASERIVEILVNQRSFR